MNDPHLNSCLQELCSVKETGTHTGKAVKDDTCWGSGVWGSSEEALGLEWLVVALACTEGMEA